MNSEQLKQLEQLEQLKLKVEERAEELRNKTAGIYSAFGVPEFKIAYDISPIDLKYTGNVGETIFTSSGYIMNLSPHLLLRFGERYINEVVPHEFTHLLVKRIYPSGKNKGIDLDPHGPEFEEISRSIGLTPISVSELG